MSFSPNTTSTTTTTTRPEALEYARPGISSSGRSIARQLWSSAGMLIVFIAVCIGASIFIPGFLSWPNMKGLGLSVATVGMISCTMLFCLASGDFDLSVGSIVAMAGMLAAVVTNATGSVVLGVASALVAGTLVGVCNGFVIAQLGINALIATLATMQIARGMAFMISSTSVGITNASFYSLGITSFIGVPTPIWLTLACFIFFGLLLRQTTFGRNTLAIGGNSEAARLAGIAVTRTKIVIFAMQGLIAAFAGCVLAARMTSGQPNTAIGLELQVISACVLGGVSLTGGIGNMGGVIIGVLIMGIVQNAMNLKGLDFRYQYIVNGSILLAAVLLDKLQQRGAR